MPTATEEKVRETKLYRRLLDTVDLEIRKDGEKRTLRFSASSETPVDRWYGTEILSHELSAIRLDRAKRGAMPLLFNHNIDDPIGMITEAKVERGRLMVEASLFATERGKEVEAMIDGGLRNVSLAYRTYTVEENVKENRFTATDWEPHEVSVVTVPADPTVGIGRGAETEYEVRMVRALQPTAAMPPTKESRMAGEGNASAGASAVISEEKTEVVTVEAEQPRLSAVEMEKGRKRAIGNLCQMNNIGEDFRDMWINQGLTLEQVSDELLKVMEERGKSNPRPASLLGLSPTETKRYSLRKAILACKDNSWTKEAPFELECSREVAKKLNVLQEPTKFFVPFDMLSSAPQVGRRDLTAASAAAGGYLVSTDNLGFIDILRNRSVAFRMGVRRLSGLMGNVTIPKQTGAATAYWLATEATDITESAQTFAQVALTPKNVGAYTEISRQLLLQSSPGAEGIVSNDLAAQVALAADLAVLAGTGTEQPQGIIGTSGVGSTTATSVDYGKVLDFQADVAAANVVPVSGGYVTTSAVAKILMTKSRFANTDTPLWEGNMWDGRMAGFAAMSSEQVTAGYMIFGDWSEVVVGEWGVLEVEINPFANFKAGIIGVRAIYSLDVGVRRAAAFSVSTSVTA